MGLKIRQQSKTTEDSSEKNEIVYSFSAGIIPATVDQRLSPRQFVNLASGSVYPDFDRHLNHTDAVMSDREPLHIGMDFNVMNMAAVFNMTRDGRPISVNELTGVRDTPTMAATLKDRYPRRTISIYPDASGQSRKSRNASASDLSILRQVGFTVQVDCTNPAMKDRVLSVIGMVLNSTGERIWKVNTNNWPRITENLEQQAYDKNGGLIKSVASTTSTMRRVISWRTSSRLSEK